MSLGNDLTPVVREESILNGGDITPATRLEYFLAKAAAGGGGGGGSVYSPVLAQTTKSVSSHWVSGFSGGPILEGASYRVIVNGTTYEPLTGTAGEEGYICLGDTYVADSDPSGDYPFGIFYKNSNLYAWLETGDSMTMQIDQIIQAVQVPTPAAADTGKVLTADNGSVKWATGGGGGGSDFLYLIATGEVDYDPDDGFFAKTSYTATDLQNAFMLDTFKYVLAVFPYFSSVEGVTSYSYENGAMNVVPVMDTSGSLLGITDQSLYIFTDDNDYVWIGAASVM